MIGEQRIYASVFHRIGRHTGPHQALFLAVGTLNYICKTRAAVAVIPMLIAYLLSLMLLASPAIAGTVDNCASVLGSISVELRVARSLPPGKPSTFRCPENTEPLLGASKQRIVNSLGAPDATGNAGESDIEWSYFFASSADEHGVAGIPELTFSFDEQQLVSSVRCQRTR